MDFYQRLRELKSSQYGAFIQNVSKLGDPQEIIAHIAAMPICCQEYRGVFAGTYEVRIDNRFLVVCRKDKIWLLRAESLESFYVCACETFRDYHFEVNGLFFNVKPDNAYGLYSALVALCPDPVKPLKSLEPMRPMDGLMLLFDERQLTVRKMSLFGRIKKEIPIPWENIRSCYQLYDSDPESNYTTLVLCLADGTQMPIRACWDSGGFTIARRIKAFQPWMLYDFPHEK